MRFKILLISLFFTELCLAQITNTVAAEESKKSELSAVFSLYQNTGMGTFLPKESRQADIGTSLAVKPAYLTSPLYKDRQLKILFDQEFGVAWIDSKAKGSKKPTFNLADLKLRASIKNALHFPDVGVGFTPEMRIEIPWGHSSRAANKMLGFSASLTSKWSKHGFNLSYKPVAYAYMYRSNYKSSSCGDDQALIKLNESHVAAKSTGPKESYRQPSSFADTTNYQLPNGKCIAKSRQTLAALENGAYLGYERGAHSVTIGMRLNHSFLRPMKDTPLLAHSKVPEGPYTVASTGLVEYIYLLPSTTTLSIAAGVKSTQPLRDEHGSFNLPFYDYKNPRSNNTQVYVGLDLTV